MWFPVSCSTKDNSNASKESNPEKQPKIVLSLCDDLGFVDPASYEHPHIQTSHLDHVAANDLKLTLFYSAVPVCSPSRVGLITGRSPNRAGVYDWIPPALKKKPDYRNLVHMQAREVTIPTLLKQADYQSCAVKKWHCNSKFNTTPQPDHFGFDHWFATQNNTTPCHGNPVNFIRNGTEMGPLEGYSCQLIEMITKLVLSNYQGLMDDTHVWNQNKLTI